MFKKSKFVYLIPGLLLQSAPVFAKKVPEGFVVLPKECIRATSFYAPKHPISILTGVARFWLSEPNESPEIFWVGDSGTGYKMLSSIMSLPQGFDLFSIQDVKRFELWRATNSGTEYLIFEFTKTYLDKTEFTKSLGPAFQLMESNWIPVASQDDDWVKDYTTRFGGELPVLTSFFRPIRNR